MNKTAAVAAMAESAGWDFLKQWISKKIEDTNKISSVDRNDIIRSVYTAQSRMDVYKSIIKWVEDEVNKNKKGGK
jgi:hypothetical protein